MEEEQDGDDVFVDSSDTLLLGNQVKGTKLRVLRHSDGGTSPLPENVAASSEDVSQKSMDSSSTAAIEDALRSEQEFLEYVLTAMPSVADIMVHKTSTVSEPGYSIAREEGSPMRKTSSRSAVKGNSKVGLDHLDNLCKLMEQLSELREANTKLQRRVQYLEDVKTLHELTREVNEVNEIVSQPLEVSFGESEKQLVNSDEILDDKYNKRNQSDRRHHGGGLYKSKTSPAIGQERLRERSKSVGHEMVDSKSGKKRFPKWSRVKEALGWERTTPVNYADRRQSERQRSSPRQAQRQNRGGRGGSKTQSCKEYRSSEPLIGPEILLAASSEEDVGELPTDRLRLEYIHEADSPVANSNPSSGNAASSSEGERPAVTRVATASRSSAPVAILVHELQSNLSEDFNKKILEWERMKSSATVRNPNKSSFKNVPGLNQTSSNTTHEHKHKTEKEKLQKSEKTSKQRVKDLSWLQKEIEKVEKEKERLAKERKKYEDKAQRLENLRKTVLDAKTTNKNEVLVKTSAGEFRFEGISDDFTKKLYEWETKKGVGPELSTIALLDSSRHGLRVNERGKLQKGLSHSDTSINDVVGSHSLSPPTQTSCTSLPSLIKESSLRVPQERQHSSRANSEPDLFSSSAKEASPSVKSEGEDKSSVIGVSSADENYLTLLEENASLLEELKKEEALCQGLESEMQSAEERFNEMTWKHEKEMDNYRGQLWEVHRPGSQPRDLEESLKLIAKRKNLVEELEIKVEQLKAEKDHVEGIYRVRNERRAELAAELSNKIKELREAKNAVSASLQHQQGPGEEWERGSVAESEAPGAKESAVYEDNNGNGNDVTTAVETPGENRSNNNRKWQPVKKSSTASFSEHGADSEDERRRRSESRAYSEQSELNSLIHEASASNTGCSSPMEVPDSLCSSPRGHFPPQITVRRSSAGNVSSLSGPECSESSSLNEAVSFALRLPNRRWRAASSSSSSDNDDNYSTSSDSSFLEDIPNNRKSWSRHGLSRQERTTEIPPEDEAECTYYVPITEEKDDQLDTDTKDQKPVEESTSEDVTPKISNASENQFVPDETLEEEPKFRRPNFDFFAEDDLATPTVQMDRNWQFQTLSEPEPIPTHYAEMETVAPLSVSPVRYEILPQSQSATSTVDEMVPPLLPKTHPKYFFEPFTSLTDLVKPQKFKTSEEIETSVKPKPLSSFSSLKLSADSPVIKSRSPRRLKSDKERNSVCSDGTTNQESINNSTNLFNLNGNKYWPTKVPSWDSENTRPKYHPVELPITRVDSKVKYHPIEIPVTQEESQPISTSNIKREARITSDSKARIQARIKANEELLRNYEMDKIAAEIEEKKEMKNEPKTIIHKIELEDSSKPADTTCRKSATLDRPKPPETDIARSSSRGFLRKLRKSNQSGSTSAVGALCRQSMFLALDNPPPNTNETATLNLPQKSSSQSAIGAKSCPSSPETKPKSRGWFAKNIFKR